ncbi:uncharacterized protein ACRADG_009281 [Cochliomyia hominivorax]
MKICILISFVCLVISQLNTQTLASPPKGGIGDGYIYPVTKIGTKHKSSTTYYAKPLYPPVKRATGPKPSVYKVIIHDQSQTQNGPASQQKHILKIIHLKRQRGGAAAVRGGGVGHHGKSVKVFKIINVKQVNGGHSGSWSK